MPSKAIGRSTNHRKGLYLAVLSLTCILLLSLGAAVSAVQFQQDDSAKVRNLAFVVNDAGRGPGCGALSIIDVATPQVLYRGTSEHSVGKIDVDYHLLHVLGSPKLGGSPRYSRWSRSSSGFAEWSESLLGGPGSLEGLTAVSPVVFLQDDTSAIIGLNQLDANVAAIDVTTLQKLPDGSSFPAASKYGFSKTGMPSVILPSDDGSVLHLIGAFGRVTTLETTSLTALTPSIEISPFVPDSELQAALASRNYTSTSEIVFADLSPDGRYVVTNRWASPTLNIVDLHDRRSWTLPLPGGGLTMTGGVSFNHGWENPGLLAVHGLSEIVVYRFVPHGPLEELSRHPAYGLPHFSSSRHQDTPGNVAWSASGDFIIASTDHGDNDFVVLRVDECGRRITYVNEVAVCTDKSVRNQGREIWTANKRLQPPSDHRPRCPAPESYPTASPPPTPVPTRTPVATPVDPHPSSLEYEEKVVALEASSRLRLPGCGGLTYFTAGSGLPRHRLGGMYDGGRVAVTTDGNSLIIGPSSDETGVYSVWHDLGRSPVSLWGTRWQQAIVTPTMGIPLAYGAMSVVWADTQVLLTYADRQSGRTTLGLFDRFTPSDDPPSTPLATVEFERGIPAAIVLEDYTRDDALQRYGGTAWVVTDLGEVWRVTIRNMEVMTLEGPVASAGGPIPTSGDTSPATRWVNAALSLDERFLFVSGWGIPTIKIVDLVTGAVRQHTIDNATMSGDIATNRGWENEGLVAVHAGTSLVVYAFDPSSTALTELQRVALPTPHNDAGNPEPGYIAWSTNGLMLFATIDEQESEIAAIWVRSCGSTLEEIYRISACQASGERNRGRDIITNNGFIWPQAGYEPRCPPLRSGATPTATADSGQKHRVFLPRLNLDRTP